MEVEGLTKVEYVDNSTVIRAQNLNDIQDSIVTLEEDMETINNVATLQYTVVSTF